MTPVTRSLLSVLFALSLAACGASPLAPTTAPAPALTAQAPAEPLAPVPAPTEAPAAPEPAPAPPSPEAGPVSGPDLERLPFRATVREAYWYHGGAAVLAGTFDVSFSDGTLSFGPLTLPAVDLDGDILARHDGATINVRVGAGAWSYSSKLGIASGTLDGGR